MLQLTISAVIFVMALVASGHAVIYKREPRAAALWILVIWLIPAVGPILYLLSVSIECDDRRSQCEARWSTIARPPIGPPRELATRNRVRSRG